MIPSTSESALELKARGGYYTPPEVTAFIASWAIQDRDDQVLEPACGDGAFLTAAARRLAELGANNLSGLVGIEKVEQEAAKAAALVPDAPIRRASFFDVGASEFKDLFDVVIGNPPYIRYHGFSGLERASGLARAGEQGVHLTRLASSWAHFVVHATSFLAEEGRLGLVLPAELLVTDYAQPVREYLLARFTSVRIIAFDRMLFPDAQVDAVLLLASSDGPPGLSVTRLTGPSDLAGVDLSVTRPGRQPGQRWSASLDPHADATYATLLRSPAFHVLADVASVDIGVVTGANAYFVLTQSEAHRSGLPAEYLATVVERPRDVMGLVVQDHETSRMLLLPQAELPQSPAIARYLEVGRESGVPNRYKCRVRRSWYSVPLPKKLPHAFLPYMTGDVPRLIVNEPMGWSTNLLHGVTLKAGSPDVRALSAAMLSSATFLSAEVEGRPYGGGVLKLETKEAERLLLPRLSQKVEEILVGMHTELDVLSRAGRIAKASQLVDAVLGIDTQALDVARRVFRTRRLERGGRSRTQAMVS